MISLKYQQQIMLITFDGYRGIKPDKAKILLTAFSKRLEVWSI